MSDAQEGPPNEFMRLYELQLLSYLDGNGKSYTVYKWLSDEPPYTEAIGMLESAKLAMFHVATHPEEEE